MSSNVLKDVVHFDYDRLFNGAVDVDWLLSDPTKAASAAAAFVFHGPNYHGVSERDVVGTGHKLIDSASLFMTILDNLVSDTEHPFSLAIAGFGSGKSHLAVTLAQLLETTDTDLQKTLLANIRQADENIEKHISGILQNLVQNVLVITINGMNNFDLAAEVLSQIRNKFEHLGISTEALDSLRKRFRNAISVLKNLDATLLTPLFTELDVSTKEAIIEKLSALDESTYAKVHDFLDSLGIPLIAIGDETIKDILKLISEKYVGKDKPFKKVLIIFDEFGHYTEFATTHSQVAGNGALQHLFEGVQENADKITFVGFIQYELKAYEQRLSSDYKNEIRRFITRFQSAEKYYLSINLETLIASLLIKVKKAYNVPQETVDALFTALHGWFPSAQNHAVWQSKEMFSRVIAEGCFPLSPLAIWLLFHLSAGGQYLQQRSALSLLKNALDANQQFLLTPEMPFLPPVCLWTEDLQREFEEVEDQTGRRAIVQSYNVVVERNGQHLSENELKVLRSIVLVTQSKLKASDRNDAINALQAFTGLDVVSFEKAVQRLENEWNVITYDDSFHMFDILGDSVSKSQFLKYLKRRIDENYDIEQQSKLFIKYASRTEVLNGVACGFADEKSISTPEWTYEPRYAYWSLLQHYVSSYVKDVGERTRFNPVDNPRGIVVYCYVEPSLDKQNVLVETRKLLKKAIRESGKDAVPIIIVLLFDDAGIGKVLSEIDVLESLPADAKETYGRLASAHLIKQTESLKEKVKAEILSRHYITLFSDDEIPPRLTALGQFLFEKMFPKILPFPFDGYKSSRTNAAQDCMEFTRKLMFQSFCFDDVKTMQVRQKNRITSVLQASWKAFNKDGTVASLAGLGSAKSMESDWDKLLYGNKELNAANAIELACDAPYGANLASAGLLFGVYIQARRSILSSIRNGEMVELSSLADKLFDGTVLSIKELTETVLVKIDVTGSEWDQFLSDWDNAEGYADRVAYLEKAVELEIRITIPMQLRWKFKALKDSAKDASRKIEDAVIAESDAILKIEKGIEKDDIWLLSHGAAKLLDCAEMKRKDAMWSHNEIAQLVHYADTTKQIIIQHFSAWLKLQIPSSKTVNALSELKQRLVVQTGNNLKRLQLKEQVEQVEEHYNAINRNIEAIIASQKNINEINAWLEKNTIIPRDITYSQIRALSSASKQFIEGLSVQKRQMRRLSQDVLLAELEECSERLLTFQKAVFISEKEIKAKGDNIWNSVLCVKTADSLLGQIQEMERVYAGDETNLEDFRKMRLVVQAILNNWRQLGSLQLPYDDYCVQTVIARKEFLSRFSEGDLPPWNLEETFDSMMNECELSRTEASKNWLENMAVRVVEIADMSSQQADEFLRIVSYPPTYFSGDVLEKKLATIRNQVEKHLESKGIEWLYEKFQQLSTSAKKIFRSLLEQM